MEGLRIVKLLLIFTVAAFDRSILRRFARINEVVANALVSTVNIERVQRLHEEIAAFVRTGVGVREGAVIVRLDGLDGMRETGLDLPQKRDVVVIRLLVIDREVSPT